MDELICREKRQLEASAAPQVQEEDAAEVAEVTRQLAKGLEVERWGSGALTHRKEEIPVGHQ